VTTSKVQTLDDTIPLAPLLELFARIAEELEWCEEAEKEFTAATGIRFIPNSSGCCSECDSQLGLPAVDRFTPVPGQPIEVRRTQVVLALRAAHLAARTTCTGRVIPVGRRGCCTNGPMAAGLQRLLDLVSPESEAK
jgi:hypothetical protein